jgi:hypothetical protein
MALALKIDEPSPEEQFRSKIDEWREDPVLFVREALGAEPDFNPKTGTYSENRWQTAVLQALAEGETRIAVKSGHGVGKSTLLSWAILWFITTRYPCKIGCTAPTGHQLYDVLWAEMRLWRNKMPPALKDQLVFKANELQLKGGGSETFAAARTARKENPEALQGLHSANMMVICDEASGIDEAIFEAAGGAKSTKGAIWLMTGNPTRTSGYFNRAFTRAASVFKQFTVSCIGNAFVDPDYVEEVKDEHGEDSNVYRVRVLGEFPTSDDDTLIPLELVEAAIERDISDEGAVSVWGVDCARFGDDDSVLVKRKGAVLDPDIKVWHKLNTMELVGKIKHEYDVIRPSDRPDHIFVDVIGIGSGVVDRLSELGLPVYGINVAELPGASKKDANRLRDELWLNAFDWFSARNCKIPDNGRLVEELTTIRKKFTSSGKTRVESKDEMKARGFKSPDIGDAFVLTFAFTGAVHAGISSKHTSWKKPIKRKLAVVV